MRWGGGPELRELPTWKSHAPSPWASALHCGGLQRRAPGGAGGKHQSSRLTKALGSRGGTRRAWPSGKACLWSTTAACGDWAPGTSAVSRSRLDLGATWL